MNQLFPKRFKFIREVLTTTASVLLADVVVAFLSVLPIMGDKSNGDYPSEEMLMKVILISYFLFLIGLGVYWRLIHKSTSKIIGVSLGAVPVLWQLGRLLIKSIG